MIFLNNRTCCRVEFNQIQVIHVESSTPSKFGWNNEPATQMKLKSAADQLTLSKHSRSGPCAQGSQSRHQYHTRTGCFLMNSQQNKYLKHKEKHLLLLISSEVQAAPVEYMENACTLFKWVGEHAFNEAYGTFNTTERHSVNAMHWKDNVHSLYSNMQTLYTLTCKLNV